MNNFFIWKNIHKQSVQMAMPNLSTTFYFTGKSIFIMTVSTIFYYLFCGYRVKGEFRNFELLENFMQSSFRAAVL